MAKKILVKKQSGEPKKNALAQGARAAVSSDNSYEAKDIYVLKGLEPVRRRPGMYIGSTGTDGLHHLIWEIVDNSLDEAQNGYAKIIEVQLLPQNRVSVCDDGRGIPVDPHPQTKKSALETAACTLHAGGKFGGTSYKIAGGLHGVGLSVVNALSKWMRIDVYKRDGKWAGAWMQEYARGKPKAHVKKLGATDKQGTFIVFEPDPVIFSEIKFDIKHILDHLREQAYLVRGITIRFVDARDETKEPMRYTFYFEGGIVSYLKYLTEDETPVHKNLFFMAKDVSDMHIEVALRYIDDVQSLEVSFANNIKTGEGGMHLTGFRSAITRVLNDAAKEYNIFKNGNEFSTLTGDDVREGLVAIVHVKLHEPQFEGQTKAKLGNPEARSVVENAMNAGFKEFLERNPDDAKAILEKVALAAKARIAAKTAKDFVLRKSVLEGSSLPGKLSDCQTRKAEDAEIFIVEGQSAGGSAKEGRDRRFQAILPLRGKPLNVEKSRLDKILANEEIRSLIVALGTAIAQDFNLAKLRYHKIIIMADADVDGMHIRTLLLTLFFRYFQDMITQGYLYLAQPPLFRIQKGKEIRYVYSDKEEEKEKAIQEVLKLVKAEPQKQKVEIPEATDEIGETETGSDDISLYKGVSVQRYKGLGEMNPAQLWETTMNPDTRVVKQVTIDDAVEADRLFNVLMGDDVLPRKKFIQSYATEVKQVDI